MKKYAPLFAAPFLLTVVACSDGPAENAGEDMDEAVEEVTGENQDTFENAGEEMDEAVDEAEEAAEDATDEPSR
ncbi:hypothetical protein [Oceanicaulis sp. MMSF_3324]|uniref:hypothetical protein n=1 Tax=Oceanicaulis sp. MMSF_3324 TaxID=3046702 RepID=UPI00273E3C96|nr:hypothetical protein [Oceanicaulis sp. MMSF_3324]